MYCLYISFLLFFFISDTLPLVDMYGLEGLREVIISTLKIEKCHLFHKVRDYCQSVRSTGCDSFNVTFEGCAKNQYSSFLFVKLELQYPRVTPFVISSFSKAGDASCLQCKLSISDRIFLACCLDKIL